MSTTGGVRRVGRGLLPLIVGAVGLPVLLVAPTAAHAVAPVCWGITDDTPELFIFHPNTVSPQPPTSVPLSRVFRGEGLAYRASTNSIALFSDSPSHLWYFNLDTNTETEIVTPLPGHIDGAAMWLNPADPTDEQLWVTSGAQLYRLDPDTAAVLSGPHALPAIGGSPGGLGFEPQLGTLWASDDRPESVLYSIELATFVATKVADIRFADGAKPDAESLDFAADGEIYTEEDNGDKKGFRYILQIDPATGLVTPAAGPIPGVGDLEGLACNSGSNVVIEPGGPQIDLQKYVNADDADVAPGPEVNEATPVEFLYRVTNTGNVDLFDVRIVDDKGVVVVCPSGTADIAVLLIGQIVDCAGSGLAVLGPYVNIGTATGHPRPATNPDGTPGDPVLISSSDPANYLGKEVVVVAPPTVPPIVATTTPTTGPPPTTVAITQPPSSVPPSRPSTTPTTLAVELPETGGSPAMLWMLGTIVLIVGVTIHRTTRRVPVRH